MLELLGGLKLWLYGILAVAIIALLGGIAHAIYRAGSNAKQLEWDESSRERRLLESRVANTASARLEGDSVQIRTRFRTVDRVVDRIVDRPVYRNVCLDADGLCLVNAAIRGEGADSCKPDAAVRGAAGAN